MIEFLSISNVIGIWNLAIEYNIMDLRKQCFDYIMVNFEQIVLTSDEFEKLKKRQLFSLLVCDELNVHKEECVFESILKWINYNKHKRIKQRFQLNKAISTMQIWDNICIDI
ncbi:hypothetical protein GJ496_004970 [Pomphorhynchus laevis]|nr:hypothetical protein GJ496_004970 [Pomphorhynchus laevis]